MFGEDGDPNRDYVFFGVTAEKFVSLNGYHYYFENEGYTLSKIPNGIKDIVIPNNVKFDNTNYPVKSIAKYVNRFNKSIESLKMSNGITHIGEYAFKDSTKLETVNFSESLEIIGKSAFANCSSLTSIDMSNNVTEIGEGAFSECISLETINLSENLIELKSSIFKYCISLETVNLPSNIEVIGNNAFANCSSLTSVDMHNNVTEIGEGAFSECISLETINLSENLIELKSSIFKYCISLETVNLPSNIEVIGNNAFANCSSLTSVDMHNNVTEIGEGAFSECISLETINLSENLIELKSFIFEYCISLETVNLPSNIEVIGDYAFAHCTSLTHLTLPNNLQEIKDFTFYNCNSMQDVVFPEGLLSIGSLAFGFCESLESINLPESLISIGSLAFEHCINVKDVVMGDNVVELGFGAFRFCYNLENIYLSKSIEIIKVWTFYKCNALNSIIIPNSVTKIEMGAFISCETLSRVTLPDGLINIYYDAFSNCNAIEEYIISDTNASFLTDEGVIYNKERTELILYPEAKSSSTYLISTEVALINMYSLSNNLYLEDIIVEESNEHFSSEDGVLYNKDKTELIAYPKNKMTENFTILDSVEIINVVDLNANVNLKNINVDVNNTEFASVNGILYNKEITELVAYPFAKTDEIYILPDSLESIKTSFLFISFVEFYDNYIIETFISNIYLKEIIANEENENFSSVEGVLYDKNITKMIFYPRGKTDVSYNVPNTVSSIQYESLAMAEHLKSIMVGSGNEDYISIDGVLYKKLGDSSITLNIYPSAKIDNEYTWHFYTNNTYGEKMLLGYTYEDSYIYNYNLQEIYIIYGDDYNPRSLVRFMTSFIFSIKGNMKIFNEFNQRDFLNYLGAYNFSVDEIDGYDINFLLCTQVPIVWGYKKY